MVLEDMTNALQRRRALQRISAKTERPASPVPARHELRATVTPNNKSGNNDVVSARPGDGGARVRACAVVTPDGATSVWRGDPATHLPEEVFHLVLALAGGRACVSAASVRRAWRLATATTLDALPPFASSTNSSLRLTWAGHRRHRHLVEARDGAHGTYAAAPATRKRRDVDLAKELRRTGSGWGCLGASFGGARALDDCIIVMDLAGREFEKRKAWHARDLPSLSKSGAGFLEFDCGWSLRDDFDEEARARCRDLSQRGDDATARVVFFESVEALSIDLVAYSLSEDVVVDLCHWNPDSRVDEIHTIGKSLVIVAESDGLSRDPVNALGSHVYLGAQIQASLATGEGIVSLQVNFCDSEGLELRGVHEKHGAVTVTDCLGAALDAVEAKRRLARSL